MVGFREELARLGEDPRAYFDETEAFVRGGDVLTPKTRDLITGSWGGEVFELSGTADLCYMMMECQAHAGLHAHDDPWLVEVVEPGTARQVAEGERGEFLFTSLLDSSLAFVRWRSEDIGYINTEPCAGGRTSTRRAQLERDIPRPSIAWSGGFADELSLSPHALGVEVIPGTGRGGESRYVVAEVRTHFDDPELDLRIPGAHLRIHPRAGPGIICAPVPGSRGSPTQPPLARRRTMSLPPIARAIARAIARVTALALVGLGHPLRGYAHDTHLSSPTGEPGPAAAHVHLGGHVFAAASPSVVWRAVAGVIVAALVLARRLR